MDLAQQAEKITPNMTLQVGMLEFLHCCKKKSTLYIFCQWHLKWQNQAVILKCKKAELLWHLIPYIETLLPTVTDNYTYEKDTVNEKI